jgi:YVTN family beta-propeller protein
MKKTQTFCRYCAVAAAAAMIVLSALSLTAVGRFVIVQTNSAGDNVHIIDPTTNKIVGEISGIEASHGAAIAPDGSRLYISDEALSTLDIVDAKTLKVTKQIPLTGRPNNLAISRDGRRAFVGIIQAPGGVDVIDTTSIPKAPFTTPTSPRTATTSSPVRLSARRSTSSTPGPKNRRGRWKWIWASVR